MSERVETIIGIICFMGVMVGLMIEANAVYVGGWSLW